MIDSFLNIWYNQQLGQLLGWITWTILAAFSIIFAFRESDERFTFFVKLIATVLWSVPWAVVCWLGTLCPPIMGMIIVYLGWLTYKSFIK